MLAVTFFATLSTALEFAVLVGVVAVAAGVPQPHDAPAPDARAAGSTFAAAPLRAGRAGRTALPQLKVLRVDGSLFFGAVEHVRDEIEAARRARPGVRHLLLVGSGINFIDVAGCELLVHEAAVLRDAGVTLYACNLKPEVRGALERGGFLDVFGRDRVFDTKDEAIRSIYARIDPAACEACTVRVFVECAARARAPALSV